MPEYDYRIKFRVRAESYGDPVCEITNLELKHTFAPGEIVESKNGDTRYEIIFSEEKNGYLSGQFYMIMDCWGGAKIRCEFSQTQINTDNIVLKTIFHNVPDSTLYVKPETIRKEIQEAFLDAATVLTDFSIKDTVKINQPYTYLYINESGKVVAVSTDAKGNIDTKETTISASNLKENTLVQGPNNEELVITKKGQVMGKEEFNATGGNGILLKEYHRKSDSLAQWQINFSKYDGQTYAFDHIASGDHGIFSSAEYYPQSGSYDFRYKSVECGKSDKVRVEFDTYPQADSVIFKDKYGVTYPIKDHILTFTGVSKADTNFIYAYRGDQKIGKLFVNTYQRQKLTVVLVSVNGAKLPNKSDLQKDLNTIYSQAVTEWNVETDQITISDLNSFTHGGSSWTGVYNDDQKRVLEAYDKKIDKDKYYLFFVENATTNGVAGYMPRYFQCGFIYNRANNRTIAHELGHGAFGLEHTFKGDVKEASDNLMDYNFKEDLWHFQWDEIHNPKIKLLKWNQKESDGELWLYSFFLPLLTGTGVGYLNVDLSAEIGDIVFGAKTGVSFGLAMDKTGNLALYGSVTAFCYFQNHYQCPYESTSEYIGTIIGLGGGISISNGYFWSYDDLRDFMGSGHTIDVGHKLLMGGIDGNDQKNYPQGIHFGGSFSLGTTPFDYSKSYTKALILRLSEFGNLFRIFKATDHHSSFKTGFENMDGHLYLNFLGDRINSLLTIIEENDYYITIDANSKY